MATFRYIVADVFTDTPLEPPLRTRCSYLSTTNLDAAIEATKPPLIGICSQRSCEGSQRR
jgi:hypothetical protein